MKIFADKRIKTLFLIMFFDIFIFTLILLLLFLFKVPCPSVFVFISALAGVMVITIALYIYLSNQNKIIEKAEKQITEYISGSRNVRIECCEEGALYRLFHTVNTLASILNAHAENEYRSKEFLRNTISDISHQLKTPLAALNVYNGILQTETQGIPQAQEFTALTEKELERIEALVQSLLKITKLDSGTIQMEKKPENIYEIMKDIEEHFRFRAKRENKQIHLKGDKNITLPCDRSWFIQAIENIVKNALDHTEAEGQIYIEWKYLPSEVQITVKDNGKGIHPEDIYHIFKRFYRSRFSKDTQGIGLGLPLAKAIIEEHSGSIEVDSEVGKGSVFIINFPIPTKL